MIEAYDFDENTTTVMEYACGTGRELGFNEFPHLLDL